MFINNIAVMTSGTDAPGMNAAIRAVVRTAIDNNVKVWGVCDGYRGLIDDNIIELDSKLVSDTIQRGGTFLGTSFCKRFHEPEFRQIAYENLKRRGIGSLIVIGGDGSLNGAYNFAQETNFPVVCIPATIENDIWGTDYSIGFDTAVNTVLHAINNIRDTAKAHKRTFIIETMGNKCGLLATYSAIAGGGHMLLVPEHKYDQSKVIERAKYMHENGKAYLVIIASEGVCDTRELAKALKEETGISTRLTVLGLIQRGGSPTARDRIFASTLGEQAALASISGLCNVVFGLKNGKVVCLDLHDCITNDRQKSYPEELKKLAEVIAI